MWILRFYLLVTLTKRIKLESKIWVFWADFDRRSSASDFSKRVRASDK